MKTKLIIAGVGNLIDAVATYILTQYYGVPELNPFMAWMLQWPEFAMIFKLAVISLVLIYAYYSECNKYTETLATFASLIYGAMGIYYIVYFIIIILNVYIR